MGLSLNDDSRKTCNAEDEEKGTDKEGDIQWCLCPIVIHFHP